MASDSFVTVAALLYPAYLALQLEAPLTQSFTPIESLLLDIVLGTLAVGLPIVTVLAIRFLWDRSMNLGRSKELEKLIWQLHRIASAMESQMNLSFPAVQPGYGGGSRSCVSQTDCRPSSCRQSCCCNSKCSRCDSGASPSPSPSPSRRTDSSSRAGTPRSFC